MGTASHDRRRVSPHDDGTLTRHELIGGAMVAMNPPRFAHAQLVQNVGQSLAGVLLIWQDDRRVRLRARGEAVPGEA